MRNLPAILFAIALLTGVSYISYTEHQQRLSKAALKAVNVEASYHKLPNGTLVYEEKPGRPVEEIEPAAGDSGPQGGPPRYVYDPVSQTYRMQSR